METKERNTIIGAISLMIGLILILFSLPFIISFTSAFTSDMLAYTLLSSYTYLYLDLFFLAITMFIYAYFLIKPTRTFKGKQNLAISAMVFGLVLVILPMIGIFLGIYSMTSYGYFEYYMITYMAIYVVPNFVLIIPGVALLLHGRFLRKKPRTEEL